MVRDLPELVLEWLLNDVEGSLRERAPQAPTTFVRPDNAFRGIQVQVMDETWRVAAVEGTSHSRRALQGRQPRTPVTVGDATVAVNARRRKYRYHALAAAWRGRNRTVLLTVVPGDADDGSEGIADTVPHSASSTQPPTPSQPSTPEQDEGLYQLWSYMYEAM